MEILEQTRPPATPLAEIRGNITLGDEVTLFQGLGCESGIIGFICLTNDSGIGR
jgi:hypothetical protein